LNPAERRGLLFVLGFLAFSAVYNGLVMSPVLEQMAREFGITTGTAGLVVAAYGAPGIAVALVAGPYSDRIGRKPFLVIGPLVMGISTIASAVAPTFALIVAARIASGVGASVLFPNVNATVADIYPFRERGKAVATVIGLNTMASVVGVPVAGIVAEATSWRVSVALVGVLAIVASGVLFLRMPNAQGTNRESRVRALYALILRDRSAVAAIISSMLGALFWFTWATYIVVYFQRTFFLSEGLASTVALTQGLGVLVGSQIGGRLGDRVGHRRIVAGAIVITGFLLLLQTNLALRDRRPQPPALGRYRCSLRDEQRAHDRAGPRGTRHDARAVRLRAEPRDRAGRVRRRPSRRWTRLLAARGLLFRGRRARGAHRAAVRSRGADRPRGAAAPLGAGAPILGYETVTETLWARTVTDRFGHDTCPLLTRLAKGAGRWQRKARNLVAG